MKDLIAPAWKEYELLDTGGGRKLERFGDRILVRPEQGATWHQRLPLGEWEKLSLGEFSENEGGRGAWMCRENFPSPWELRYPLKDRIILFTLKPTEFKHLGVFPEQSQNWEYLYAQGQPGERVLNLFAHTGGSSQAAALAGCEVTHIDSVYAMVGWARENSERNGVSGIRWICEDSLAFVERELKRGNSYKRIIMDPPTFGFSGKGRQWKIERDLEPLLRGSAKLLEPGGELILNCYSVRMGEERLNTLLAKIFSGYSLEMARLNLRDNFERKLDCGYLARLAKYT